MTFYYDDLTCLHVYVLALKSKKIISKAQRKNSYAGWLEKKEVTFHTDVTLTAHISSLTLATKS